MRSIIITGMVCVLVCVVLLGGAQAVGNYVVGQEKCDRSSLNARGIIPDTMNKIKEMFVFPSIFVKAVDTVAGEVKAILSQFGIKTRPHIYNEEVSTTKKTKRGLAKK
jgi:hypothetical protein